jgi:hypothetical protein
LAHPATDDEDTRIFPAIATLDLAASEAQCKYAQLQEIENG